MLGKENIKEQVTDNQMDYVANESATVDYEDRLSEDISNGTWHSALDDAASDEVMKKAAFFVETFVKEFEEKLSECSKEAKPGSKTRNPGKILTHVNPIVNNVIPPSPLKLGICKISEGIDFLAAKKHKDRVRKVFAALVLLEDQMRKILVEASLEIFQKFDKQLTGVVDADSSSWKRGVEKSAIDAASRVINYISVSNEKGEFSVSHITKGVVLGESKKRRPLATCFGYRVKDKQSGEISLTSALYGNVGIKKIEDNATKYYQLNEHEKYGYRLPFTWELEEWWKVSEKYMPADPPKEEYVYILDEEEKKKLVSNILKEISGNDPVRKKDIEKLNEKIEKLHVYSEDKDKNTFSFNFGHLPEFFIKREEVLNELEKKLSSKNQEVKMSRVVLIHGKHGTGKSELAKNCVYSKKNDWKKIAWIDATAYSTLSQSFRNLAEELKIPIENDMDLNSVRDREIESIVKDIYKDFRDVKSLFIFDSASEYAGIEKFLPSHFPDLFFRREKPYVLITSRNEKNWKKEIEKIELDNGFSLGEAITFFERTLGIKDRLQNCYLVELAEALDFLPLALAQATAYIKQEKFDIIKYLERYDKAMKESNLDYFEAQGISPELFTTLKVNFDKIRREKNIGQQSHDIVTCMAYLSSNQIDIEEIFLQKKLEKDKQQILDTLDRFHKFSVIKLEESIARIHKGVQKIIRTEKEREGTEEETLRVIMTSFSGTFKEVCQTEKKVIN